MSNKVKASIAAATITAATAFIVTWEGNRTKPYFDIVSVPTACAGVTKGIDFSHIYTADECAKMNAGQILTHAQEVMACVTRPISQNETVAIVSLAYNVGSNAICKSTLVRKLNAGEPYCDEFLKWNRAGGREVQGLTNRRNSERNLCLKGQE